MPLPWPFAGRTGQIRAIEAWIADPEVAGVVVSGPAGVGKSRTVREALSAAERRGHRTRWVVAAGSARGIPLGAFTAWVPPGVTDTVQLIRGVIDALVGPDPPGTRVLLGVDDAHLLDDLSIFVVHQLVAHYAATVMLTVRDGDPLPSSAQEIIRLGRFERIDLRPLPEADTSIMLTEALGGPVDDDTVHRLWRLTGGNLLYLRTIVEHEVAQGRITRDGELWRWAGDPVLPPDLVGLVESRIGSLPPAVGDVIDVVAVAEPMSLTVLQRLTTADAVEAAELAGLVTVEAAGGEERVRAAHPLFAEVRRHRAARTRLRRLRGLVATALADSDQADDIQTLVQRGALMADSDLLPDPDLLTRAARGAVWLADLHLSERLAQAAIEAGGGIEPGLVRAHALSWSGRGGQAESVLAGLAAGDHDDAVRARVAFLRASNLLWALGDQQRADQVIDDASGVSSAEARKYIDAFRTVSWFAADEPARAEEAARALSPDTLPPVVGAEIAWVLATVAADAGRTDDAVAIATTGYEVAKRSLDAPHMRFNIADAHVSALLLAGRVPEAEAAAGDVAEQASQLPGTAHLLGTAVAGRAMLGAGRLGAAVALLEKAVHGLSAAYGSGWGYRHRIALVTALAMRGAGGRAAAELAVLEQTHRPFRALTYERCLARAWVAAGEGAVSLAIAHAHAGAEDAARSGQFGAEVLCRQVAAQFGDRTGAGRLAELDGIVASPRSRVAARFGAALHSGDAGELRSAATGFEEIGDLVAAVDACAHAAVAYRRHDLRGSALACSADAAALAQRCDGVITPASRQANEPLPFTERERELVMLLGQGLSNRAIADKLFLSVRTVESHLYRAMAKTGTASRDELAALLKDVKESRR